MTSSLTPSVISSRASALGHLPFAAPDGQIIDLFGPVPVLANLTARQAKDLGLMTLATSGRHGLTSSASETLTKSLANRFQQRLSMAGLISSAATWKKLDTPSQRFALALMSPVSLSSAREFTLLPSISAREWKDRSQAHILARLDRGDGVAKRICAQSSELRSSQVVVGLNPSFAAWMMALPDSWPRCMPTETPSMLKRLRSS